MGPICNNYASLIGREEADINIDREEIERVSSFEYLGVRIQANRKTTPEIRRRLAMATTKLNKMANVWKGQCVDVKIRVLKSTVFPTATYGCEAWTINKTNGKLITDFEMKCYRKILRIPWTDTKSIRKSQNEFSNATITYTPNCLPDAQSAAFSLKIGTFHLSLVCFCVVCLYCIVYH